MKTLRIRKVEHLADILGLNCRKLLDLYDCRKKYIEPLILIDPRKPEKPREILDVRGELRVFQTRLLERLLRPYLHPSPYSHGGIKDRSIKTNAVEHLESVFVFKTDISNYYPTIKRDRVYKFFCEKMDCSPDVSRLCTGLCTHRYHLALGLITSPILAEQFLIPVDRRIAAACDKAGLVYTRYVDDITISGPFDFGKSGFNSSVAEILASYGFEGNDKTVSGRLQGGKPCDRLSITNIRVHEGRLDVASSYLQELHRQLKDAKNLGQGKSFDGPYFTRGQILGRIHFVSWVNPKRKDDLLRAFNQIAWRKVESEAAKQDFSILKKKLIPKQNGIRKH